MGESRILTEPIPDIRIDSKKMQHAIKIFSAALSECVGQDIGAHDTFFAYQVVGMILVEAGFNEGKTAEEFQMNKRLAQSYYMQTISKNPHLWKPKPKE